MPQSRISQILREEAPEPSAGPGKEAEKPLTFNINGKAYTEKEAQEYFSNLDKERAIALDREKRSTEEATAIKRRTKSVFDETATDREEAARALFTDLGFKPNEVEEWVANMNGSNDSDKDKKASDSDKTIAELRANQEALAESNKNVLREQMKGWATSSNQEVLTQHKGLTTLLEAAERIQGKESLSKTKTALSARLHERGLKLVVQQMEQGRESPSAELFAKAFKTAADELVGEYSAVIGDASSIGRSSETATRFDPFKNRKPADLPKYKPGMERGTLISAATDFVRDQLLSAASEESGGSGSKA